jgi:two-component system, LytTR family, sensor kinase
MIWRQRAFRWAMAFIGWTCVALFFASQTYLLYKYSGGQAHWGIIFKINLCDWYGWGLLAPGIIALARRFPLERARWTRSLPVHVAAGVGVALVKWQLDNVLRHYVLGLERATTLISGFHESLVTYWLLVGSTQAYLYYRRYREGELRSAQLSAQLAQAQLQALRMQLHPHFLFNTLNAISTLVHRDPEKADRMIARLSELLRLTLENVGVQEVPLAQELEFLERYLEIERTRFADRLVVRMEIAPEALGARTPYLILQPIVENAIRHGIAARSSAGSIVVSARRANGMLVLEVGDDGPGIAPGGDGRETKTGVGLSSTRERLEKLYGSLQRFELRNAERGGLLVTLAFPFRTASAAANSAPAAKDKRP